MVKILNNFTASFIDYPDNESSAVCVVMMGCEHHCPNCHNKDFQNYDYSEGVIECSAEELYKIVKKECERNLTNKVVLTGGDVLAPLNIAYTKQFLTVAKDLDICVYTGYDIDYVIKNEVTGYKFVKCGVYREDLKQPSEKTDEYMQFASINQRLYDGFNNLLSENGRYNFQ